jgi:hypothetical protein
MVFERYTSRRVHVPPKAAEPQTILVFLESRIQDSVDQAETMILATPSIYLILQFDVRSIELKL